VVIGEMVVDNPWDAIKDAVHGATKSASPFAMDDAYAIDSFFPTGLKVVWYQILNLVGAKYVKIEDPVDRNLNRGIEGIRGIMWIRGIIGTGGIRGTHDS
jgi:hypothetical protein